MELSPPRSGRLPLEAPSRNLITIRLCFASSRLVWADDGSYRPEADPRMASLASVGFLQLICSCSTVAKGRQQASAKGRV